MVPRTRQLAYNGTLPPWATDRRTAIPGPPDTAPLTPRGRAWRAYFAFLLLYLGASEVQAWRRLAEPGAMDVALRTATMAFALAALTGLYGFIRRRAILRPLVWWLLLALLAAAAASSAAVLMSAPLPAEGRLLRLALYLLPLAPLFIALGRYAADRTLWR